MKKCSVCDIEKTLDSFYGRSLLCKPCHNQRGREYYRKNIEAVKKYELSRKLTPKRLEQRLKYLRKSRAKQFSKAKARDAVNNAVRDGRLTKQPCEVCRDLSVQAHHENYSMPLVVKWLCFKHHRELHGQSVAI